MILPSTYLFSMIILIIGMLCLGSWANTYKAGGSRLRFELYYYDFAIGTVVAALIFALTFGSLGWDGFSFLDDLRNAGKRQDLWAFLAGCIFNLGNMLLLGSVSITGMAVAFPISMGLAITIGTIWAYVANPSGNLLLLAAGCFCLLVAVVVDALAFKAHSINKLLVLAQQGKTKSTKKSFNGKGIFLAVVSGFLIGGFHPLLEMARESEIGLGPYSVAFIFSAGIVFSTFVYNLFFTNLPVAGKVLDFGEYFRSSGRSHLLGIGGGMLWITGTIATFVSARAEGAALVNPALVSAIGHGAVLLSALWGLIVWKEFEGGDSRVKAFVTAMLVLLVVGLLLVSVAPLYTVK